MISEKRKVISKNCKLVRLVNVYQLMVGLGKASTTTSIWTDSSLLKGWNGSGTFTKTGSPDGLGCGEIKKKVKKIEK